MSALYHCVNSIPKELKKVFPNWMIHMKVCVNKCPWRMLWNYGTGTFDEVNLPVLCLRIGTG